MEIRDIKVMSSLVCEFRDDEIPAETVQRMLQAALVSAHGVGGNTCEMYVTDDKRNLERIADVRDGGRGESFLSAPLAVAIVADKLGDAALEEHCSAMTRVLCVEAIENGLSASVMLTHGYMLTDGTLSEDVVRGILGIPEDKAVYCVVALGYSVGIDSDVDEAELEWDRVHLV